MFSGSLLGITEACTQQGQSQKPMKMNSPRVPLQDVTNPRTPAEARLIKHIQYSPITPVTGCKVNKRRSVSVKTAISEQENIGSKKCNSTEILLNNLVYQKAMTMVADREKEYENRIQQYKEEIETLKKEKESDDDNHDSADFFGTVYPDAYINCGPPVAEQASSLTVSDSATMVTPTKCSDTGVSPIKLDSLSLLDKSTVVPLGKSVNCGITLCKPEIVVTDESDLVNISSYSPAQSAVIKTHSIGIGASPIKCQDSHTEITPVKLKTSETSKTPIKMENMQTMITPVKSQDSNTMITPVRSQDSNTMITPVKSQDSNTMVTPVKSQDSNTMVTPVKSQDSNTMVTPVKLQDSNTMVTPVKSQDSNTMVTPVKVNEQFTCVTPVKRVEVGTCTSPSRLYIPRPSEIEESHFSESSFKSHLESAAVSNLLLRSEVSKYKTEKEKIEQEMSELQREVTDVDVKVKNAQSIAQCSILRQLDESMRQQGENLQQIGDLEGKLREGEVRVKQLEDTLSAEKTRYKGRIQGLEQDLVLAYKRNKQEMSDLKSDKDQYQSSYRQSLQHIKELEAQLEQFNVLGEQVKLAVDTQVKWQEFMKESHEMLSSLVTSNNAQKDSLEKEKTRFYKDKERQNHKVEDAMRKYREMKCEYSNLDMALTQAQLSKAEVELALTTATKEITELHAKQSMQELRIQKLETECQTKATVITNLESSVKKKQELLENTLTELSDTKAANSESKDFMESECLGYQEEISDLRNQLAGSITQNDTSAETITELQQNVCDLSDELDQTKYTAHSMILKQGGEIASGLSGLERMEQVLNKMQHNIIHTDINSVTVHDENYTDQKEEFAVRKQKPTKDKNRLSFVSSILTAANDAQSPATVAESDVSDLGYQSSAFTSVSPQFTNTEVEESISPNPARLSNLFSFNPSKSAFSQVRRDSEESQHNNTSQSQSTSPVEAETEQENESEVSEMEIRLQAVFELLRKVTAALKQKDGEIRQSQDLAALKISNLQEQLSTLKSTHEKELHSHMLRRKCAEKRLDESELTHQQARSELLLNKQKLCQLRETLDAKQAEVENWVAQTKKRQMVYQGNLNKADKEIAQMDQLLQRVSNVLRKHWRSVGQLSGIEEWYRDLTQYRA